MALNSPSNLKLGQLGHIAGGNGNSTSATSLAATCRGSAASTSMWADFRCGNLNMELVSGPNNAGQKRAYFKIGLKNDVGEYMGGGSSVTFISTGLISSLGDDTGNSYYYHLNEDSEVGGLYQIRIAQNSNNSGDYEATHDPSVGNPQYTYFQDSTIKDKFRFKGQVGQ